MVINFKQKQNKMKKAALMMVVFLMTSLLGFSQITTSTISGVVKDQKGEPIPGVTIHATHNPTGTNYYSVTNTKGAFVIPAVRVGGPYTIHATFVGLRKGELKDINTSLGLTENVEFVLIEETTQLKEVVVSANKYEMDLTSEKINFQKQSIEEHRKHNNAEIEKKHIHVFVLF